MTSKGRHPTIRALIVAVAAVLCAPAVLTTHGASAAVTLKPLKVVLLGDSYAAGNGARDADGGRNYEGVTGCYRSPTNWASQYVKWLRSQAWTVTYVNRACSGGVLQDLWQARSMGSKEVMIPAIALPPSPTPAQITRKALETRCKPAHPADEYYEAEYRDSVILEGYVQFVVECERFLYPQIDAIGRDTDLVLMTGGGNDVRFAKIVEQCFAPFFRDPGDCRDNVEAARGDLDLVQERLTEALGRIHRKARPDTKVAVVGYPYLADNDDFELVHRRLGFTWESDRYPAAKEVRALGREGDGQQRAAVEAANASARRDGDGDYVTFVDRVKGHFAGHEPKPELGTGNPDRWMSEIEHRIRVENYHYNAEGHKELGELLRDYGTFAAAGAAGLNSSNLDLAFVIDTTGSMGSTIDAVKAFSTQLVDVLASRTGSYRFALVDYRDFPERTGSSGDYPARVDLDFTDSVTDITTEIHALSLGYGGDGPETAWSGIDSALNLSWRPGVKKVLVQLGDAPALEPEPISGLTRAAIAAKARAIDPVEIYNVDTGDSGPDLAALAVDSGGASLKVASTSDVAGQILRAIDTTLAKPFAWAGQAYTGQVGRPLTFSSAGSHDPDGTIERYDWDFDGDGAIDATNTTGDDVVWKPTVEVEGLATLTVTDDRGLTAVATAPISVSNDGDGAPGADDNCPSAYNPGQEDDDGDGEGDLCDPDFEVPTTDQPGIGTAIGPPPLVDAGGPYAGVAGTSIQLAGTATDPRDRHLDLTWQVDSSLCTITAAGTDAAARCSAAVDTTVRLIADNGEGGVVAAEAPLSISSAPVGDSLKVRFASTAYRELTATLPRSALATLGGPGGTLVLGGRGTFDDGTGTFLLLIVRIGSRVPIGLITTEGSVAYRGIITRLGAATIDDGARSYRARAVGTTTDRPRTRVVATIEIIDR